MNDSTHEWSSRAVLRSLPWLFFSRHGMSPENLESLTFCPDVSVVQFLRNKSRWYPRLSPCVDLEITYDLVITLGCLTFPVPSLFSNASSSFERLFPLKQYSFRTLFYSISSLPCISSLVSSCVVVSFTPDTLLLFQAMFSRQQRMFRDRESILCVVS